MADETFIIINLETQENDYSKNLPDFQKKEG